MSLFGRCPQDDLLYLTQFPQLPVTSVSPHASGFGRPLLCRYAVDTSSASEFIQKKLREGSLRRCFRFMPYYLELAIVIPLHPVCTYKFIRAFISLSVWVFFYADMK
ncbi:hypothetical protein KIN20_021430 [Parelaphostrongylus tenuis]|uniref:Uncharacterized protein n=1 Tax=Parelaphostrongylus tenuis TaxID=148309 RepID=A0AAD5QW68_PARTN|nr:hypothetical protein KIN20_021430 [Parelaphostrongylus tenuis]